MSGATRKLSSNDDLPQLQSLEDQKVKRTSSQQSKFKLYKRGSPPKASYSSLKNEQRNAEKYYGYDRMNLDLLVVAAAKDLENNHSIPVNSS